MKREAKEGALYVVMEERKHHVKRAMERAPHL